MQPDIGTPVGEAGSSGVRRFHVERIRHCSTTVSGRTGLRSYQFGIQAEAAVQLCSSMTPNPTVNRTRRLMP
jgi:hypothetical protein